MRATKLEQTFQVELMDGTRTFSCKDSQDLLSGMEKAGIKDIRGCRNGGCGVCKIHIVEGEAEFRVMSRAHVTLEEQNQGIVLACRVYPRSDMKIKIYQKPTV